ncbi:MAG: hypothetical protein ACI84R_004139 [Candidatus Azotimanducaceae bacterium]|jgi:hypothetical protein
MNREGVYTTNESTTVEGFNGLRLRAYNAASEEFPTPAGVALVQVETLNTLQVIARPKSQQ